MNILGVIYIADWLLILLVVAYAIYKFLGWRYTEMSDLGIPGPKPTIPLGNLGDMFTMGLTELDNNMIKKYGKIYGMYMGRDPMITIADIDICRKILIKDFDSFTDRMMLYLMKKTADILVETLDRYASTGELYEAKELSCAFTSDNIASTSFGIELNAQKTPSHPFIRYSKMIFESQLKNTWIMIAVFMPYLAKWIEKIKPSATPQDAEKYFIDLLQQAIEARKKNPQKQAKDFIQILLDAEENLSQIDDETKAIFDDGLGATTLQDKGGLTESEVIGNLFLFLLAGHDTTASSMSFVLYNLALHPEVQQKLYEEINTVVGDKELTGEMLNQMTYMDMVINETLRLYPLATKVDRKATRDVQYGDLRIPKGMLVAIPIRYFHYDENVWPEPEKFDPERFTPEEKSKRDPLYYLPFGLGPRMCVGMRFAMWTQKVALTYILRNFTLHKSDKTQVPLVMKKDVGTLQPEHGIWLKVERR